MLSIYKELIQSKIDDITSLLNEISGEIKIEKQFTNRGNIRLLLSKVEVKIETIALTLSVEESNDNEH